MSERDLVTIAKGRLDMRSRKLYLNSEPLSNILAIYADGDITICISKKREETRRQILDQIFVEEGEVHQ